MEGERLITANRDKLQAENDILTSATSTLGLISTGKTTAEFLSAVKDLFHSALLSIGTDDSQGQAEAQAFGMAQRVVTEDSVNTRRLLTAALVTELNDDLANLQRGQQGGGR